MVMVIKRGKRAQSVVEYVLIFLVVAAAITVVHRYVYRSMNARLKQVQEQLEYKKTAD